MKSYHVGLNVEHISGGVGGVVEEVTRVEVHGGVGAHGRTQLGHSDESRFINSGHPVGCRVAAVEVARVNFRILINGVSV